MTPSDDLLLLDTNVLLFLARGSTIGQWLESHFGLRSRPQSPLISVVTVGEALAFAQRRRWGGAKMSELESLLRDLVIVDINSEDVLRAVLLTTDKDFDHLDRVYLSRIWIDPHHPEAPQNVPS